MAGFYWLASYPKSGNTWFRVFLSNLNSDSSDPYSINQLTEGRIASQRELLDDVLGFDTADLPADEIDELRPAVYRWLAINGADTYYKIHDACVIDGLNDPAYLSGTLYIIRNPLDVAPSYAHHLGCSLDDAIRQMGDPDKAFCSGSRGLSRQVRQKLLSWSGHVLSWLDATGAPMHVIRYEDMHDTPLETFAGAARFLGLPCDAASIKRAISLSSFHELSAQEASSGFRERQAPNGQFFRRGECGGWRDTLSVEQVRRIVTDHQDVMARFGYLQDALDWLSAQPQDGALR
ncbi:sulfotransferase domain-containing protein [Pseudomonas sp. PDM16]|uniref:sulfotransferase domain-containing protein n=1 Tax=Pseudomonas sp. PDM16 TaxID=2769292 RepID=UPI00177B3202|nr:sulfotransferase domain-containing protein [Pseudomonas sp. PDM16]MBD9415030.1 sulfotransferase domain-containing protein [Pseudomonas sp. PDM16]